MVQKRPCGEEELFEVSSKQPRLDEPSSQLVSVSEFSHEPMALKPYASGGDEGNYAKVIPDKKLDVGNGGEVSVLSDKDIATNIHGSASNSSWLSSSTSEEDIRSQSPLHIYQFSDQYNFDLPFRTVTHPREVYSSLVSSSPQKLVPIGPDYQAELPELVGYGGKNKPILEGTHEFLDCPSHLLDSEFVDHVGETNKLCGTCIIPMHKMDIPADHGEVAGAGRVECSCEDAGSIRCVRLHIMEARKKLKISLGEETFHRLGLSDMGEEVAERWSEEEEDLFHEVVYSNPASLGKNFWNHLAFEFPSRTRKELVSYYFNVFILQRRAAQNRFDPLNIDSDNDEWQEIDDIADGEVKQTDGDEDSVVESPVYQNDLGQNEIYEDDDQAYEEDDDQAYDEDAGVATWENYKPVGVGSRKVFTDVSKDCPDKLFDNNCSKSSIQHLEKGLLDDAGEGSQGSCTSDAAGVASEAPLVKTDNSRHWASDFSGIGSGCGHDFVMEPCSAKEWDVGYFGSENEADLLPTCTMMDEVFGDGAWSYNYRDDRA